jgi:hypothetical protein
MRPVFLFKLGGVRPFGQDGYEMRLFLFSHVSITFFQSTASYVSQKHPERLGTFLIDMFEEALEPASGLGRRQMQDLGRYLLQHWAVHLIQHEPEALTPLARLVRDPKTSALGPRKKPLCCNSQVVKDLADALLAAYLKQGADTVGAFLDQVFTEVGAKHPDEYRLFRPLGRRLHGHILLKDVKDRDPFQDAWMKIKSRSQGPLEFTDADPPPPTAPSPGTEAPKPEPSKPEPPKPSAPEQHNGIDIDKLWDESEDSPEVEDPEPLPGGKRLNIVPEKVEDYQDIVCDDNEPAFVVTTRKARWSTEGACSTSRRPAKRSPIGTWIPPSTPSHGRTRTAGCWPRRCHGGKGSTASIGRTSSGARIPSGVTSRA